MIEVCPHGIPLVHKDQCSKCWMWENSDAGKLFAANQCIADLERAAETSRAEHAAALAALSEAYATNESLRTEHAAALGLATARIRELEGDREELLGLARWWEASHLHYDRCKATRAIVARIEKATKRTT